MEAVLLDFFCLKDPRCVKDKRTTPWSISAWDVKSTGVNEILTTTVDCNCCPVLISSTFYLVWWRLVSAGLPHAVDMIPLLGTPGD